MLACGGGGGGKPKVAVGPAVDEKQAHKDASGLVEEIYETIGRGSYKDGLFSLSVEPLVVFGPRRADAMTTRTDALVALADALDDKGKKIPMRSSSLEVVVSPGGRSAWAFDVVNVDGTAFAATAILTNADDLWQVTTLELARVYAGKELKTELDKDAVVPPSATAAGAVDEAAAGAVERFKRGLMDQAQWGEDLGARTDALVVGPTSNDIVKGKKAIKKAWKKRVEDKTRAALAGEITAGTSDDGLLAWVSAPITRVSGEAEDQVVPLRAFAVFEKAGDDWKMIVLHEAVAVDAPGAGAPFKKSLPPKLVEESPPEETAKAEPPKDDAKKKSKKKKKKKTKKKTAEDEDS